MEEDTNTNPIIDNVLGNYIYDAITHDKKEQLLYIIIMLQNYIIENIAELKEKIGEKP